jgi:hypothetical protein
LRENGVEVPDITLEEEGEEGDAEKIASLIQDARWMEASRLLSWKDKSDLAKHARYQADAVAKRLALFEFDWWTDREDGQWDDGSTYCSQLTLDETCTLKSDMTIKDGVVIQRMVFDYLPITEERCLAFVRYIDLYKYYLDDEGNLDFKAEELHKFADNDNLVRLSWIFPLLPFLPRFGLLLNRVLVDLLDDPICPRAGFIVLEDDPPKKELRGVPFQSTGTRFHGNAMMFGELVDGGVRMHWRSDFVSPIPVWSVPRSFLPAYIGPVAHNIYNTLIEAAWCDDDELGHLHTERIAAEPVFYERFHRRVSGIRERKGYKQASKPTIQPRPSGKCNRASCPHMKNPRRGNNGGTHCCRKCQLFGRCSVNCKKIPYVPLEGIEGPPIAARE